MGNSIQAPNYTQTPNEIFDLMPEMEDTELRVTMAIVRETFGWHKESAKLSLNNLVKLTGLSKPGVIAGINAGIDRGTIRKIEDGAGNQYSLVVNSVNYPSKPSLPEVVNSVDHPQSTEFTDLHLPKERSKERKKKDIPAAQAAPEPTEHQQMFEKVCEIVGLDYKVIDEKAKGQVAQTLGILKKGGYTIEHLCRFGKEVWVNDWRWIKHRQRPSLKDLRTEIGKLTAKPLLAKDPAADWAGVPTYMLQQQENFYA